MTLAERQSPTIDTALEALGDARLTIEDRAAAYGVIHQVQLRLNRALKAIKEDLIQHMVRNDLRSMGPLSIKRTPFDVAWPCNSEGNWGDAGVQDAMAALYDSPARPFIRRIPAHYEIATAELGAAVHLGNPDAIDLHRALKERGWRTEEGKRLSLEVREAK